MLNNLASTLKFLGISLIVFSLILTYQRYSPQRLAFATDFQTQNTLSTNLSQTPTQIKIEKLGIDLPIYPAQIKDGKWQLTDRGVSYLTTSPLPGQIGNSILYGHNYTNLLGNLTKIKPGDQITIFYTDGSSKNFEVSYTQEVSPQNSQVLENSSDTRITLYTCSGFLDSKRFIATAILQ